MPQLTHASARFLTLTARRLAHPAGPALLFCLLAGCASLTNPVAEGIPVRYLPDDLLAKPKDATQTIPLDLLGQPQPEVYRLEPGDVLGVWIEGILQESSKERPALAPVQVPPLVQQGEQRRLPPTLGYPITIRPDGTIRLPMIEPLKVQGLSVTEAEDAIRAVYLKGKLLPEGRDRIVVSMMYPRQTSVVVLRQESGNITLGPEGLAGGKRNTGHLLNLPGNENDVLHAIAQTGGMPGLDDYNEVIVFRNAGSERERLALIEKLRSTPPGRHPPAIPGAHPVELPLRLPPNMPVPFGPQDVVLHDGDVVFIEARDHDVFYTAGLLPSGEHVLPRDYDLDVVKAVARVRGPLINGAYGVNNLSGTLVQPGLGGPSPTLLTVLRRAPDGTKVPIYVDLDRALHDARECILVKAGDVLILQEKPSEALARYMTQTFFNFNAAWTVFQNSSGVGVLNVSSPDRLSSPYLFVNQP